MWDGGPLRQFSKRHVSSHYKAYCGPFLKGFAGAYVCDGCQGPCPGIYRVDREWQCRSCKDCKPVSDAKIGDRCSKSKSRPAGL